MAIITEQEMERRRLVNEVELAVLNAIPADTLTLAEVIHILNKLEGRMINLLLKDEWRGEDEDASE